MTITNTINVGSTGGNASDVISPSFTSVVGDLLIAAVATYDVDIAFTDTMVNDNKGNTWHLAEGQPKGDGLPGTGVWYTVVTTGGAATTVTFQSGGGHGTYHDIAILGFHSTTGWTAPLDTTTHANASDINDPMQVTAAAAISGSQVAVAVCCTNTGDTNAYAPPTDYLLGYFQNDGSSYNAFASAYRIGETGTPSPGFTKAGSSQTQASQTFVTFKENGTGAGGDVTGVGATVLVVAGIGQIGGTDPDPVKISDRGIRTNTSTGDATLTITNPTLIAVNNYLIARVSVDNSGSSGARPGLTVSDARNGTWAHGTGGNQDPGAASAGVSTYLCYVKVTTPYQAGDTILFDFATGTPRSAIVVEEWANIDRITPLAVAENQANNVSSTAQPAISRTPTAVGQLMYVCAGIEGFSSYWGAQDSDSTGGSWSDLTKDEANTGTNTTSVSVYGGYKVVTSTAAQTWNNTLGTTSDWAACAVVFAKYISPINIIGTEATVEVVAGTGPIGFSIIGTPATVTVVAGTGTLTATTAVTGTSAAVTVVAGVGPIQFPDTNLTGTPATVLVVAGTGTIGIDVNIAGTPATVLVVAGTGVITGNANVNGSSGTVLVVAGIGTIGGGATGIITYETSVLARTAAAVSSLTTAFTVTTADCLVVCTSIRSATDANRPVTGITYNGVPLNKIRDDNDDNQDISVGIWYLANPDVGTHDVVTTCAGVIGNNFSHMIMGLVGVDSANPVDTTGTTGLGSGTQIDLTLTTIHDNAWIVDVIYAKDDTGITVITTGGHTQRQNSVGGNSNDVNAMGTCEKATAGQQTVSWGDNLSGEVWLGSAVAFKPAASGPPNITGTSAIVTVIAGIGSIGPISVLCPTTISGRKWLDQLGNVYLLKACSSWALAENLTNAEMDSFLTTIAGLGFNAVNVSLPGHRGPGNGPWNWQANQAGDPYWATTNANDQWNTALGSGWASYDHLLAKASDLGMTVILSFYLGSNSGSGSPPTGNEGIGPVLEWQYPRIGGSTYLATLEDIGEAIATRFSSYRNLIWHLGADKEWFYGTEIGWCVDALFHGIANIEGGNPRFRICEPACAAIIGHSALTQFDDDFTWFTPLSADSFYSYDSDHVGYWDDIFDNFSIPVWDCEPPYIESDGSRYNGTPTRLKFRERPYAVFLRNGIGINWGYESITGFDQGSNYGSDTVAEALASVEIADVSHMWALVDTYCKDLTWTQDTGTFLTTGHGSGVDAAASGHSNTAALVYFPNSRTIAVDTTVLSGSGNVRLRWYDPTTGGYSSIVASEAQQSGRSITYPGNNAAGATDWILVVDLIPPTDVTGTSAVVSVIAGIGHIGPDLALYPASVSGRKVLDQNGDVFLMRTFSSWGMAVQLTDAQITTELTKLAALGFNAVTVWMSGRTATGWNEYTTVSHGNLFTGTPWQSSLGPGWAAMDWIVSEAARLGIIVNMSLGIGFGGNVAGDEIFTASTTQMHDVGAAIATRYLASPNIVWHTMFDWSPSPTNDYGLRVEAFYHGINDVEGTARPIRWMEPDNGATTYSQGWLLYGYSQFSTNTVYQYHDDSAVRFDAVWNEAGATTVPVIDCEPPYVGAPHYTGNQRQQLRERTWSVFIRGGWGINFGHEDYWSFGGAKLYGGEWTWDQVLDNSVEVVHQSYIFPVFDAYIADVSWAPNDSFVTTGLGSGDIKAAVGASATAALAYFPDSRIIAVDTTILPGSGNVRLRWYNPYTGAYTTIVDSEAQQSGRSISYPSAHADTTNDWVLVVDLVTGQIDITGTGGTVTVIAGAGTVGGQANVNGTGGNVVVNAGTGTVGGQANVSGTSGTVSVIAGTGVIGTELIVSGTSATVSVIAGTGVIGGQANIAGTSGTVSVIAGTGPVSSNIVGTGAVVAVVAGTGVITGYTDTTGTSAVITVTAGIGVITTGADIIGTSGNVYVIAGTGPASGHTNITGTGGTVVVNAGTGVIGVTTNITGTGATVNVFAGTGIVVGHASVTGTSATINVFASIGVIGVTTNINGTGGTVVVNAGTGIITTGADIIGSSGIISVIAGSGSVVGHASVTGTVATVNVFAGTGVIGVIINVSGASASINVVSGIGIITGHASVSGNSAIVVVRAGIGQITGRIFPAPQGAILII